MTPPANVADTLHTLAAWADAGWLRRLDSAMAAFVHRLDPQAPPAVLVLSALLAHMEGRGHTSLPLRPCVAAPVELLGWHGPARQALLDAWPRWFPGPDAPGAPDTWRAALALSPVVRRAQPVVDDAAAPPPTDTGQPLVLDGPPDAPMLYLRRYWVHETRVAQAVRQRTAQPRPLDPALLRPWLDRLFGPSRPNASGPDWQKIACALALRGGLTVITGGPGTGKTYTAARLLALLLATHPEPSQLKIGLAAPTGKAAARLRGAIDQSLQELQARLGQHLDLHGLAERLGPAQTVHALLGARPDTRQFRHHARHPLDVDVLLVDETSMVHLELMAALFDALPAGAQLVLLGDKDQLASVEAGSVLGDLCAEAAAAPYGAVTRDYLQAATGEPLPATAAGSPLAQQTAMLRQSQRFGSAIGQLAQAVNQGRVQGGAAGPGVYDLLAETARHAAQGPQPSVDVPIWLATGASPADVCALAVHGRPGASPSYTDYLRLIRQGPPSAVSGATPIHPANADTDAHTLWARSVLHAFDHFRVLCAVHDGPWGDRQLNLDIQRALARAGWLQPAGEWYVGRPVMVTRNDPALGLYNGDVGVVLPAATGGGLRAHFLDGPRLRSVAVNRLSQVDTCFAMTVHKSQGSEFVHTALVLPAGGGDILSREWLYTGITRARTHLTLVEPTPGLLGQAVQRQFPRASGLPWRLQGETSPAS